MRKLLLIMGFIMSLSFLNAQKLTITGKVTDLSGAAIAGATIKEKGTSNGTTAANDGSFTITVSEGAFLVISAIGFTEQEFEAKSGLNAVLQAENKLLDEVVVTALGIKRNKNSLPYAAQQVNGEDVSRIRTGNAAAALSGKVSGLEIRQGNSIGGSTNIVIRGSKSLTGNNQALFVVDGVPVDNTINNSSNQQRGAGGYDYGNAAADINPDDIETINVLKGAAATALYGSRAANGVVMITTKTAKRGLGITVNSGVTIGTIDKSTFPKYQKEYGAGYETVYQKDGFFYFDVDGDGEKDLVVPTSEDASFGAKFNPDLMVYHWDAFDPASPNYKKARPWVAAQNSPETFYETGVSTNNSIMLDAAGDKTTVKLGYTRNDETGVLPNSRVTKNIVNFGLSYKVTQRLTASASVNYSKIDGKGRYGTGYSGLNVNQSFRQWYQTNVDLQEQKEAYFRNLQNVTWNWKDPSTEVGTVPIYFDNYYWTRYKNFETDTRTRTFGNVSLNYKVTDWLSLLGRVSVDNYTELQEERRAVGSQGVAFYSRFDRTYNETNFDLIANFDKNITEDLNLKALAGVNLRKNALSSVYAATNGGLVVADLYAISNSLGTVSAPTEAYQPKRVDGYFGGLTLGYRNYLTLDATIRRDRSSTLPENNNAYNYYAVSGSWLFSTHLKNASWLSSGKIRLNYATVGNDAPWGSVKDAYDFINPFGGALLYSLPGTQNNSALLPEKTKSKEIGLELAFFKSRLGFDATYYITNTVNQIIPVAVSTATGYSSKYLNAGEVQNKGIELSMYGTPVKTRDFSWTVNVNWTRNRNMVVALYDTSKNLQLATSQGGVSINASLGQPYGTIQGRAINTLNGQPLVNDNGTYSTTSTTTNVIGNVNPKWIGGIYNTFRYKNLSLGFLIDVRKGGELFSLDMFYEQYTGILPESAGLNDLGNPKRNSLEDGGGVILPGVTADGKPNTVRIATNTYSIPVSEYIYDAGYVKLRELTLTYSFPAAMIAKTKVFKGIDLSFIGRNLWIIHKNMKYSDPEETLSAGNVQGIQSGAYPTTRYFGCNLKLKF
ncbi:SusC/RagA family TonB-linked outer membrane protein [Foetidibacter luteolus]|uniref:SusC/RagA family TonB-linked outer membrane protein n=1 Tax=Foetidibacter luteolus TaxID=2608880 RepID=UPI00129B09E7|nr:SusC/RagA family TonB-linked outer membrane protein [Foetidibacter luteolus]